jgi:hypothetical protein
MAKRFRFSLRDLLMITFWFSAFGGMFYFMRLVGGYTADWSESARTIVCVPLGVMFYVVLCGAIGSLFGKTKAGLLCGLVIGAIGAFFMSVIGLDAIRS